MFPAAILITGHRCPGTPGHRRSPESVCQLPALVSGHLANKKMICLISQKKLRKKLCFFAPEQADCVATSQGSRSTLTGLPALTGLWVPGLGHDACRAGPASTPCWPRPRPMPGPLGRASMGGAMIEVPLGCRHFPSNFYATSVGNEPWINLSFYDIPACWEQSKHDKTILAKLAQVKTT